ncbi:N-acetylmuramoyl-L-alanine amidase, partial [Neobacillus sp. YIM B02564]
MNEFVISSGHCLKVQGASDIINEVNEARKVVNKVYEYLKELNCTVYKFHDDTSTTQSKNLSTIVNYHNSKKRDLDISVHFNAASRTNNPRGVEVLYVSDNSKQIAEKVVNAIAKASGLKNRGIKYRDNLYFLNKTNKPAILIEVCFVDSKADVNVYHNKFNEICKAIAETLSGKKLSETKVTVAKPKEETKVKQQPKSVAKPKYPNKLYKVTSPL